jgi:energy-coupling factor transporter ATP-binding protein EcfA2
MFLGSSGSGKTYLQERVSELIPPEDKIEITQITENAFYYFRQDELRHRLLLIEDLDGAESSMYPLRELQSKRRISKTVTLKDSKGNLKTVTLTVEGPVSVSGCTTRERIYEDNANRCLLLHIDGSKDQDRKILDYQTKAWPGVRSTGRRNTIPVPAAACTAGADAGTGDQSLCEIYPAPRNSVQAPPDDDAATGLYRGDHLLSPIPTAGETGRSGPSVCRKHGSRYPGSFCVTKGCAVQQE